MRGVRGYQPPTGTSPYEFFSPELKYCICKFNTNIFRQQYRPPMKRSSPFLPPLKSLLPMSANRPSKSVGLFFSGQDYKQQCQAAAQAALNSASALIGGMSLLPEALRMMPTGLRSLRTNGFFSGTRIFQTTSVDSWPPFAGY